MPEISTELSEREQEILRLVATGASNKEVAQQLFISTNTVKVHLRNIYAKIGVASRTEAAMHAVNSGLVSAGFPVQIPEVSNGNLEPELTAETLVGKQAFFGVKPVILWSGFAIILIFLIASWFIRPSPTSAPAAGVVPGVTETPRWQQLAPMNIARRGLAAAVYDDRIYIFGGETSQGVSNSGEQYDPNRNSWIKLQEKPTPVMDVSAVVLGGKIFIPGGRTNNDQATNVLEIYDPNQNSWQVGAPLPRTVYGYALAAFEGRMYLFGGWENGVPVGFAWEYEPSQDIWRELPGLPTPRGYACAGVAGRKIFVIGGSDGSKALQINEVYKPDLQTSAADPWSEAAEMPERVFGMGCVSLADNIYLAGGESSSQEQPSTTLAYFPQTDSWQNYETPIRPIGFQPGVVNLGMSIFILGGGVDGAPTRDMLSFRAMYIVSIPVINK